MTRTGFLLLHVANLAVVVTGVAYAWMLYLLEPVDEFALWNHPWQGTMRDIHIIAAPVLVLLVGGALSIHAMPRLRGRDGGGRYTGLAMLAGFLPMALSGSLLQTAVDEGWARTWMIVHLATSALWTAATVMHLLAMARSRRPRG